MDTVVNSELLTNDKEHTFLQKKNKVDLLPFNPNLSAMSAVSFANFLYLYRLGTNGPTKLDNFAFHQWIEKKCRLVLSLIFHIVKCHANHMNRARILVGFKSTTSTDESFTRQIRVYQHKKVGEKVDENRDKFYLSPTVCQHVWQLLLCLSHTPTWVCQHVYANFTLSCDSRLMLTQ